MKRFLAVFLPVALLAWMVAYDYHAAAPPAPISGGLSAVTIPQGGVPFTFACSNQFPDVGSTYSGNFNGYIYRVVTLTNDFNFAATVNRYPGKSLCFVILGDTTNHAATFPGTWRWVNSSAPATIVSNSTSVLSLFSSGTTEAAIVAAWRSSTDTNLTIGLSGSGIAGTSARFLSSTVLTNGLIYDDGTNVIFNGASVTNVHAQTVADISTNAVPGANVTGVLPMGTLTSLGTNLPNALLATDGAGGLFWTNSPTVLNVVANGTVTTTNLVEQQTTCVTVTPGDGTGTNFAVNFTTSGKQKLIVTNMVNFLYATNHSTGRGTTILLDNTSGSDQLIAFTAATRKSLGINTTLTNNTAMVVSWYYDGSLIWAMQGQFTQ